MLELEPGDPRKVGPYRVLGRLGSGGMGKVFLGHSPGGHLVAIKAVRTELAEDPAFRLRFAREVAAVRKVSGIFTVPVVDADPDALCPWLVTAYVDGPSLDDAVDRRGPLPVTSVLMLAAGLAEGLGVIHAAGVIHRDLKPSNVLLASDGPRIIDFGIARAADETELTRTGWIIGSPGFMSPEEAQGLDVSPASDIFNLGAVLTFAATGEGPFGTGSANALLYRVVHSEPAADGLPGEIRPLIKRCLAKDPQQRPTTDEVQAELEPVHPGADWLLWPAAETVQTEAPSGTESDRDTGAPVPVRVPTELAALPPAEASCNTSTVTFMGSLSRLLRRRSTSGRHRVQATSRLAEQAPGVSELPQKPSETAAMDRAGEALRLLRDAEQIASQMRSSRKGYFLATIAQLVASADPARGEQIARNLARGTRARALATVADVLADTYPAQAARMLNDAHQHFRQGSDRNYKSVRVVLSPSTLAKVVRALARTEPAIATGLLESATQTAQHQGEEHVRNWLLAGIAEAAAGTDLAKAEQIARGLSLGTESSSEDMRSIALGRIAMALVTSDPADADRLARSACSVSVAGNSWAAEALAEVGEEAARTDPAHAARLLAEAASMARTSGGNPTLESITKAVAREVSYHDPEATQLASRLEGEYALVQVARVAARTDQPILAAQLLAKAAQHARHSYLTPSEGLPSAGKDRWIETKDSLLKMVEAAAGVDSAQAEQIASGIDSDHERDEALGRIAAAVARTDPARAEQIARSIDAAAERDEALGRIAAAVAHADPARAEVIARSITRAKWRAHVALAAAVADPSKAEQIARGIDSGNEGHEALGQIAAAVARADPARAEVIARSIPDHAIQAMALARVAVAVARTDSTLAARLLGEAKRIADGLVGYDEKDKTLSWIAKTAAGVDPARAEQIARSIRWEETRDKTLSWIAKTAAGVDPARAEQIARSITGHSKRLQALVSVARVWLD